MDNILSWLWLCENPLLTPKIRYSLLSHFETVENIYKASREDYEKLPFLSQEQKDSLCKKERDFRTLLELCRINKVKILTMDMEEYPLCLKNLKNPPFILYCRGDFINLNERLCISVVGTRNMSPYGKNCAYNLSNALAQSGAIIVSGLADGVDAMAHRGALDANMPTVAVIGCGVNMVYPKKNAVLMQEILSKGMVISEYPLWTPPEKYHFPERNRIIAAIGHGTLVIEADIQSGSLITAKNARELNKDIFAVPGSIYSIYSRGTNFLIKDGAIPVLDPDDVLNEYREKYEHLLLNGMNDKKEHNIKEETPQVTIALKPVDIPPADEVEEKILSLTGKVPVSADFLCDELKMDISLLSTKLLMLELSGKIKKCAGNTYTRI